MVFDSSNCKSRGRELAQECVYPLDGWHQEPRVGVLGGRVFPVSLVCTWFSAGFLMVVKGLPGTAFPSWFSQGRVSSRIPDWASLDPLSTQEPITTVREEWEVLIGFYSSAAEKRGAARTQKYTNKWGRVRPLSGSLECVRTAEWSERWEEDQPCP